MISKKMILLLMLTFSSAITLLGAAGKNTALHQAVLKENAEERKTAVVVELAKIKEGLWNNDKDSFKALSRENKTVLYLAVEKKDAEVVKLILEKEAKLNIDGLAINISMLKCLGKTPVELALEMSDEEAAKLAILKHFKSHIKDQRESKKYSTFMPPFFGIDNVGNALKAIDAKIKKLETPEKKDEPNAEKKSDGDAKGKDEVAAEDDKDSDMDEEEAKVEAVENENKSPSLVNRSLVKNSDQSKVEEEKETPFIFDAANQDSESESNLEESDEDEEVLEEDDQKSSNDLDVNDSDDAEEESEEDDNEGSEEDKEAAFKAKEALVDQVSTVENPQNPEFKDHQNGQDLVQDTLEDKKIEENSMLTGGKVVLGGLCIGGPILYLCYQVHSDFKKLVKLNKEVRAEEQLSQSDIFMLALQKTWNRITGWFGF